MYYDLKLNYSINWTLVTFFIILGSSCEIQHNNRSIKTTASHIETTSEGESYDQIIGFKNSLQLAIHNKNFMIIPSSIDENKVFNISKSLVDDTFTLTEEYGIKPFHSNNDILGRVYTWLPKTVANTKTFEGWVVVVDSYDSKEIIALAVSGGPLFR